MTVCPAWMGRRSPSPGRLPAARSDMEQLPGTPGVAAEDSTWLDLRHVHPDFSVDAKPCRLGHEPAMTAVLGNVPGPEADPLHAGRLGRSQPWIRPYRDAIRARSDQS